MQICTIVNHISKTVNSTMNISLQNKVVLVTGASQGIGAAIAIAMGESGATVAIQYNRNEKGAKLVAQEIGDNAAIFQADFSNPKSVVRLYETVFSKYKKIDVLVNNAGIAIETADDAPDEDWLFAFQKTLNVNLVATALLCKKAIADFKQQESGIIINITSRAALRGDTPEYLAYAASKGGMMSLTRSIARMYGKSGITAFDVAPGFTKTAMAQQFIDEYGEDYAKQGIALNRLTEPTDIAPIVVFLASGLATHATGTTIHVNAASYVH